MKRYIVCLLFSSSVMAFDPSDTNRDGRIDFDEAVANPAVPSIPIDPGHTQAMQDYRWKEYNRLPESGSNEGDLESKTATNGYVILNKSQGLIKQWGSINIPASLNPFRINYTKTMRTYNVNISSTSVYEAGCDKNCPEETMAFIKNFDNAGFTVKNAYVGDGKGRLFGMTVYWVATGKL